MRKKKGFAMIEILSAILILAFLAAVAVPGFSRAKNKADANQAIAYLRTIRTAQRIHFAKNGEYACQIAADCNTSEKIKIALPGTSVVMANYVFFVTATPTTFLATAYRNDGVFITLNEAGSWGGDYTPLPTS